MERDSSEATGHIPPEEHVYCEKGTGQGEGSGCWQHWTCREPSIPAAVFSSWACVCCGHPHSPSFHNHLLCLSFPRVQRPDHQRVQAGIRECCCVLASGAFTHNSELADLACNSVWADEHHEGCLLHSASHLPATAHHIVPQVLQEPL